MIHLSLLISPQLTHALGWTLLHFIWEGLALAAICAALMAICRRASTRYAVALGTLALMLAAPVITFGILQRSESTPALAAFSVSQEIRNWVAPAEIPSSPSPASPVLSNLLLWLVEAWFGGVVFFSLRAAGGFFVVERMRRKHAQPISDRLREKCLELQRRMGIARAIRYCECLRVESPAVIGWIRPVVLFPMAALTGLNDQQLAALIVHELAHIRRLDYFVNILQVVSETVLFYHPAVWWLNKRIRAERENCCDDVVLAVCGNAVEYARALTLLEERRQAPAMAMAANRSPLFARVMRLLGVNSPSRGIRSAGIAASALCLAGALLAGNGLMAAGHSSGAQAEIHPVFAAMPPWVGSEPAPKASRSAQSEKAPAAQQKEKGKEEETRVSSGSYIDGMKAQGLDNLTADQLIALRIQGVTPEYVKEVKALGLHPTVNELISMRVQGVDPKYISDMRATGVNAGLDQIIAMRIQGVTPEYVKDMRAAGVNGDANQFIGMRVQGLTPEYIQQMKAAGVNADVNQLIGMKVQGLTPDYVKQMKAAGFDADANQLIGMRVQGVTPEYVREMRAVGVNGDANQYIAMRVQGLTPDYVKDMKAAGVKASANQLIGMRVQGLSPEYVREMKAAGIEASPNQLIGMRVQGLTPDYVKQMKALGLNADAHQLIAMRVQGVTAEYVKALQSAGLQNLSTDDYIRARVAGVTPEFIAAARSHGFKDLTIDKLIDLKNADVF